MNIKLKELVTEGFVVETLTEVSPRFDGIDIRTTLGLTENQQKQWEKKVTEKVMAATEKKLIEALENNDSIEIREVMKLFIYTSSGYKNQKGEPKKSIKAMTRRAFSEKINQ